ncbi:hypothetical protein GCM10017767_29770 [Halomonas urumqiensis]|nr:hypothetical protein GCM10017767_29770 [Halomonas urumqiensis]
MANGARRARAFVIRGKRLGGASPKDMSVSFWMPSCQHNGWMVVGKGPANDAYRMLAVIESFTLIR